MTSLPKDSEQTTTAPSAASGAQAAPAPCCSTTEQATCCEPQAKAGCCGPRASTTEPAAGSCGCR